MGSFRIVVAFVLLALPPLASAESSANRYFLEGGWGTAYTTSSGYDSSESSHYSIGARFAQRWELSTGYIHFKQFDSSRSLNADIAIDGYQLGVSYHFPLFTKISISPELGLYDWQAEATFNNREIGQDDGTALWYGIKGRVQLSKRFDINIRQQRFIDISGSDISFRSIGLRFSF